MLTSSQKTTLKNEILTDPLSLGYTGKSDSELADLLNFVPPSVSTGRRINRTSMPTSELLECVVHSEYIGLSATNRDFMAAILGMGEIDPAGNNVTASLSAVFGPGTVTRDNFLARRERPCSRAEFLDLPGLTSSDVADARLS